MVTQSVSEIFRNFRASEIKPAIEAQLASGRSPLELLQECQQAMMEIGEKFSSGEYYMSELILSAHIFASAAEVLSPLLKAASSQTPASGVIVLGTPQGDIHDLGKNIFKAMAEATGFRVIDLGVDVAPEAFVKAVRDERPDVVGLSALITTVFPALKKVVDILNSEGLREQVKIIIGGGAVGEETRRFCEADAWTLDAAEGIRICHSLIAAKRS